VAGASVTVGHSVFLGVDTANIFSSMAQCNKWC